MRTRGLSSSAIMDSEICECIVIDEEAVGLSALSLGRARRLIVNGTLMGMHITEPHDAIVAGGGKRPGEAP
jgi:hypothetical protein